VEPPFRRTGKHAKTIPFRSYQDGEKKEVATTCITRPVMDLKDIRRGACEPAEEQILKLFNYMTRRDVGRKTEFQGAS